MAITNRKSLLSSQARVQVPWIKVTLGTYTFGVFSKSVKEQARDSQGFYTSYNVQYPNYIQSLNVVKINGQVNQYTLQIKYPVRQNDDPNFFEKIFSSISGTRKIVFSYGDASMPSYIYKDEEAIITKIQTGFNFGSNGEMGSVITYTISAISSATLGMSGNYTFVNSGKKKPSDEIKRLFKNKQFGLQKLFTGMSVANLEYFIASDDAAVEIQSKTNISAIDYLSYLVGCMIPEGTRETDRQSEIYTLTLHDDTTYDKLYQNKESINGKEIVGPYFKVVKTSHTKEQSDAYEIDIGFNNSTIVTNFTIDDQENYSLYYEYNAKLNSDNYVKRLNNQGQWENIYAPTVSSGNDNYKTRAEDKTWWTKITKYPIKATITIQGLLRPATLMQYIRLNVIFPSGHKHISSGLYIVTKQVDNLDANGYRTTLSLTKISGDTSI